MSSDESDAIALDDGVESDEEKEPTATWEHEELAQVRIKVIRGHSDSINSCQYLDGDQQILTASSDQAIKFWETETGKLRHSISDAHTAIISEARCTQDGSRVVSTGWDKKVKVWDTEINKVLWTGEHDGIVMCCKFSHDGSLVCSGSDLDNALKIWDANTGELLHNLTDHHKSTITSCVFSPRDDKVITCSMDRTSKFFDLRTGKTTIVLGGHINIISSCAVSPDERKFASAAWDKSVKIWDIATGSYRSHGPDTLTGSHEGSISSCQFSPDGSMLVTGSYDTTVVVWDVDNQLQKVKLQGHTDWVQDVCFSQDQKWLLSCSRDRTVRLWNIEDSDKIPVVLEKKKAIGLKIIKCDQCGKPFSMSQLENIRDLTACVFCRLKSAERTMSSITSIFSES